MLGRCISYRRSIPFLGFFFRLCAFSRVRYTLYFLGVIKKCPSYPWPSVSGGSIEFWVFEAAGSISNEQNSAISKGQQKLIYRWWGLYKLLRANCWNSRWVVETNRWVVCLPWNFHFEHWDHWGCGSYEKSWSFVQVGERIRKNTVLSAAIWITGWLYMFNYWSIWTTNPGFFKTPSMCFSFILLFGYKLFSTHLTNFVSDGLKVEATQYIPNFSKHNLPRRVMNCFGPSLPVSGFNSILSRLGWRCTRGKVVAPQNQLARFYGKKLSNE